MKILILAVIFCFGSFAADEKIYTQKEFDAKVKAQVEKQIKRIKKSSIANLTSEVLEKESALDKKEKELQRQKEQVEMAEETLSNKIADFEKLQAKVLGCIDENKDQAKKRISALVSMISNMKPLKAADVLTVQDSKISIQILEKIEPERASKIFNLMDKEVSARLQKQYLNMRR